jgi:ankyrin repeat protein
MLQQQPETHQTYEQTSIGLFNLPHEVIFFILSFLRPEDVISFSRTSKSGKVFAQDQVLWEMFYKSRFPDHYPILARVKKYGAHEKENTIYWFNQFISRYFTSPERLLGLLLLGKQIPDAFIYNFYKALLFTKENTHLNCSSNPIKISEKALAIINNKKIKDYFRLKLAIAYHFNTKVITSLANKLNHWEWVWLWAVRYKNAEIEMLARGKFSKKPNYVIRQKISEQLALYAITVSDEAEISILIQEGLSVNHVFSYEGNITLLQKAVLIKNPEMVELMLSLGADVTLRDENGDTPLYYAVTTMNTLYERIYETASLRITSALLQAGANVNVPNEYGLTPFHCAVNSGSNVIVQMLLGDSTPDIHLADSLGNTPLHRLVVSREPVSGYSIVYRQPALEIINQLITTKEVINRPNFDGYTPFHQALRFGSIKTVQLLINLGADIHGEIPEGKSYLHLIAENTKYFNELLLLAIKYFGVVAYHDERDSNGNTPLHLAAMVGNVDGVKKMRAPENVNYQNSDGHTPLHLAVRCKHPDAMTMVRYLLRSKLMLELQDKCGCTVLHELANLRFISNNYAEVQKKRAVLNQLIVLINAGVPLDAQNSLGQTALHISIKQRNSDFTKTLLAHGADITKTNALGESPAIVAFNSHKEFFSLMLQQGLVFIKQCINAVDEENNTLLHEMAKEKESEKLKSYLTLTLNAGLDPNFLNTKKQTPLHIAVANLNYTAVRCLIGKGAICTLEIAKILNSKRNSMLMRPRKARDAIVKSLRCGNYFAQAIQSIQNPPHAILTFFKGKDYNSFLLDSRKEDAELFNELMITYLTSHDLTDSQKLKLIRHVKNTINPIDTLSLRLAQNVVLLLASGSIFNKAYPDALEFVKTYEEKCKKLDTLKDQFMISQAQRMLENYCNLYEIKKEDQKAIAQIPRY